MARILSTPAWQRLWISSAACEAESLSTCACEPTRCHPSAASASSGLAAAVLTAGCGAGVGLLAAGLGVPASVAALPAVPTALTKCSVGRRTPDL